MRATKVLLKFNELCIIRYKNVKHITLCVIIKDLLWFRRVLSEQGLRWGNKIYVRMLGFAKASCEEDHS